HSVPMATATTSDEMKTAPITSIEETGDQNKLDRKTYMAPSDEKTAEPAPPPAPPPTVTEPQQPAPEPPAAQVPAEPAPKELPHTASSMPLIGFIGIVSLAAFALLSWKQSVR